MMNRILTMTALAAMFGVSAASAAYEGEGPADAQCPAGLRSKILEHFDADGDGVLNDAEREAAREAGKRRMHKKMLEKFDTDGDGTVSEEEREAARRQFRERRHAAILKKFDADGDGSLNEEEKAAVKAAYVERCDTNGDGEVSKQERKNARKRWAKGRLHRRRKGGDCPLEDAAE